MIDEKEVLKIYELANLKIEHDEIPVIAEKYNKVLEFSRTIMEVDTTDVEGMEQVFKYHSDLREDQIEKSLSREIALKNASSTEYGYFKLKKVID